MITCRDFDQTCGYSDVEIMVNPSILVFWLLGKDAENLMYDILILTHMKIVFDFVNIA